MIFFVLLVVLVIAVVIVITQRHRKGDLLFRIRKLKNKNAALLSEMMKMRDESAYFALATDEVSQKVFTHLERALDDANSQVIAIDEALRTLETRAKSWFDYTDLYVLIGMQDEAFEEVEKIMQKARQDYGRLSKTSS